MEARKIVFFDRDGVVNLEDAPYSCNPAHFYFAPGFLELFLELKKQRVMCILVTNQSGINRGIFSENELLRLHEFMQNAINAAIALPLREAGEMPLCAGFDAIYYCPHTPEQNCACRKPKSGMLERAVADLGLDLARSECYIIGDKDSDMEAGRRAGVRTRIFVCADSEKSAPNATHKVAKIHDALGIILA